MTRYSRVLVHLCALKEECRGKLVYVVESLLIFHKQLLSAFQIKTFSWGVAPEIKLMELHNELIS